MKKKIYTFIVFLCFIIVLDRTHNSEFSQQFLEMATKAFVGEKTGQEPPENPDTQLPFELKLSNLKIEMSDGLIVTTDSLEIVSSAQLFKSLKDLKTLPNISFKTENLQISQQHSNFPQNLNINGSLKKDRSKDFELVVDVASPRFPFESNTKLWLTDLKKPAGKAQLSIKAILNAFPIASNFDLQWKNEEEININAFDLDFNNKTISAKGSLSYVKNLLELELSSFALSDDLMAGFPVLKANAKALLRDNQADVSGTIFGMGPNPFQFKGTCPFANDQAVNANLYGEIDLGTFLGIVASELPGLAGHAILDINLNGTLNTPLLTGKAQVTNGTYEGINSGVPVRDITASLTSTLKELSIVELTASDGQEGVITGNGKLAYDPERSFPFELNLNLKDTLLFSIDEAQGAGNGTITLSGDMQTGKISGDINLNKIDLPIPKKFATKSSTIDVTYVNPPNETMKKITENKKSWPLQFDLNIATSSNIKIYGRGLTSEWKGRVSITGDDTTPVLNGEVTLVEGDYNLRGKIFEIKRGALTFAGPFNKESHINLIAQRQMDRITLEILLRGPLLDPTLTLRSNPPLPQKEVLSLILFNQGTTDISPSQGEELSKSLASLIEGGDAPDLLGTLRSRIGVDSVEINRSPDGNSPSLKVGKYLTKDICVSVTKGISTDPNRVSVEATVMPHIKAEAEVGDDANGTLSLKWRKDY